MPRTSFYFIKEFENVHQCTVSTIAQKFGVLLVPPDFPMLVPRD
jgi:hypothetical protein